MSESVNLDLGCDLIFEELTEKLDGMNAAEVRALENEWMGFKDSDILRAIIHAMKQKKMRSIDKMIAQPASEPDQLHQISMIRGMEFVVRVFEQLDGIFANRKQKAMQAEGEENASATRGKHRRFTTARQRIAAES